MKVRTKILLLSSVAFLCFYVFGITVTDDGVSIGSMYSNVALRAEMSPFIYGLLPFLVLLFSGLISWFFDRR